VIEAQSSPIKEPHDHLHINQMMSAGRQASNPEHGVRISVT
jgi:hypothetical protein